MRLYRKCTIELAKKSCFQSRPQTLRTSEPSGTGEFNGTRTLRNPRIMRRCNSMPDWAQESYADQGNRTLLWWRVKAWPRGRPAMKKAVSMFFEPHEIDLSGGMFNEEK